MELPLQNVCVFVCVRDCRRVFTVLVDTLVGGLLGVSPQFALSGGGVPASLHIRSRSCAES